MSKELNDLLAHVNSSVEQYERLQNIVVVADEWSIETGILTPTLKIKRNMIEKKYQSHLTPWSESRDKVLFT